MRGYQEREHFLTADDGTKLFTRAWCADAPRGVVVLVHGIGEHCGRYQNIISAMDGLGVSFYALDHRGHGRSEGKRGHIQAFGDYVSDLDKLVCWVRDENPGLPLVLFGHSMGGVIACQYALAYPHDLDALILSSGGYRPAFSVPGWKVAMARVLSKVAPGFTMPSGLNVEHLSHDRNTVEAYLEDPMVHDRVSARWYTEFTRAGEYCLRRANELTMPLLVFHGKDDQICDYRASEELAARASSARKQVIIFPGLYHETMNETMDQREQVLTVVKEWILSAI